MSGSLDEFRSTFGRRALMRSLHAEARRSGRSLLVLGTRHGEPAAQFYKHLGYREVGVIPGYTLGASGERHDNLVLYRDLGETR